MAQNDTIVDSKHPEYEEKADIWASYRLAYLANEEYYDTTVDKFSSKEDVTQYNLRKQRAYNALPVKNYISTLGNMTWRKRFDYEYATSDDMITQLVQSNVDGMGNSLFNFHVNQVQKWLTTYDTVWIYTAQHNFQGEISLETQTQMGLNPYLVMVSPENIQNWAYKEDSQTEFSQVLMWTIDRELDEFGFYNYFNVYMLYKEDEIIKYDDEGQELDRYPNTIGKVPFVKVTIGESLISDIVRIAAAAVNLASGNLNFLNKSNFPVLKQKGAEKLESFDAGAEFGVYTGDKDSELSYLEYPTGSLDFNEKTMQKLQELADRAASQKYQSIATRQNQSGESQKENFKDVDASLAWINNTISEALKQSIWYMGLYLRKDSVELSYTAPITYLNESASEVVKRSQEVLDIAADAKSVDMRAALSENAYSPLLVGHEDKADILKAETEAIKANKGIADAMRSGVEEAEQSIQSIPSQQG